MLMRKKYDYLMDSDTPPLRLASASDDLPSVGQWPGMIRFNAYDDRLHSDAIGRNDDHRPGDHPAGRSS